MAYDYDFFISYKSDDRSWADALHAKLTARGVTAFQDVVNLRSGEVWDAQLERSLDRSRHLAVIWSSNTATAMGAWVQREIYYFEFKCRSESRRIYFVLIDEDKPPQAFGSLHAARDLHAAGARLGDVGSVGVPEWAALVDRLTNDGALGDDATQIDTVVLAATDAFWSKVDFTANVSFAPSPDAVLQAVGLKTAGPDPYEPFRKRYHAERRAWQPFGAGGPSVDGLLQDVEAELSQSLVAAGQPRIRFRHVRTDFWGADLAQVEEISRSLASRPSLVIIDPLSLYDRDLADRLQRLRKCLTSERSAVAMLGPFGVGTGGKTIRKQVQSLAMEVYAHFFEPPVPMTGVYAPSSLYVGDADEIMRLVRLVIGRSAAQVPAASPYLRNG